MAQKLYKKYLSSRIIPASEEWKKIEDDVKKVESSLFRYQVPTWIIKQGGLHGKS